MQRMWFEKMSNFCVNKYVKQFQAIDFLLQLLDTGFIKFLELVHNRFLTCTNALKKPAMPYASLHPIISCSLYTKSILSLGNTQKSINSLQWTKRSKLIHELNSCLLNDCMTSCYKTWVWRTIISWLTTNETWMLIGQFRGA